jgi:hypothetical protein
MEALAEYYSGKSLNFWDPIVRLVSSKAGRAAMGLPELVPPTSTVSPICGATTTPTSGATPAAALGNDKAFEGLTNLTNRVAHWVDRMRVQEEKIACMEAMLGLRGKYAWVPAAHSYNVTSAVAWKEDRRDEGTARQGGARPGGYQARKT